MIYFLSPVSEEKTVIPEDIQQIEQTARPQANIEPVDDSWGYEDDVEEEDFVFGQPLVTDDDEQYDEESVNQELAEIGALANSSGPVPDAAQKTKLRSAHPDSPTGDQRGSRSNPTVFKTNNPEDPADD